MKMYQEELMDHYQRPRHRGRLEHPDFDTGQYNPSCGDAVSMQGIIKDGMLECIAFEGKGCVISQAAASLLCEYVINRSVDETLSFTTADMIRLVKIPLGPIRLKCALLALHALQEGILKYQKEM